MKKQTGITLVALVITIIILLILAAITINLTIGQRGILTRAEEAGRNYGEAAKWEDEQLSNFLKEADDIINEITTGNSESVSDEVKALKAGDYIKYDTGVRNVGQEGVITCRILYAYNSPYGLQIISDRNVEEVTLGGNDWDSAKESYNHAIETLNRKSEKYVNSAYAYDGRCVGSVPTTRNGIFIAKNTENKTTVILPEEYTIPEGWESRDTGLYGEDTNYETDITAMEQSKILTQGEATGILKIDEAWLASREGLGEMHRVNSMADYNEIALFTTPLLTILSNGSYSFDELVFGLRPCISLKASHIKITGGDGKTEQTAYTIGL